MEHQGSLQVDLLTSTSATLADSLRLSSSRSLQTLEELMGRCSDLSGSVSGREPPPLKDLAGSRSLLTLRLSAAGLLERGVQWSSRAQQLLETQALGQSAFIEDMSSEAETLQQVRLPPASVPSFRGASLTFTSPPQNLGSFCSTQLLAAGAQLSGQREEVKRALEEVQDQTLNHQEELEQQRAELQQQVESSQQLVHSFLQDDLQQDIPTGT